MKSQLFQLLIPGALLATSLLAAGGSQPNLSVSDAALGKNVQQQLANYGDYGMFDDVMFQVHAGQITLTGSVTEPFKRTDMEKITAKVTGVAHVTDNIQVSPFSDADNALRSKIATAFHNDPSLARYEANPNPSIHVVVDQGKATLSGVVQTQSDRSDAALLTEYAGAAATSNNLQVVSSL